MSKLTKKVQIVDEDIYQLMVKNGMIKKFIIVNEHIKKSVIPDELIIKRTFNKVKQHEEKTLNTENNE